MVDQSYLWAIEPLAFEAMRKAKHFTAQIGAQDGNDTSAPNSIAVIDVRGPLTRQSSLFSVLFGATTYQGIQAALRAAEADERVKNIILRIDSPGGTVDGVAEAADAIRRVNSSKPVIAQVEGTAASAAYYLASQASAIYAGRNDRVGSIGVRLQLFDVSQMLANDGVESVTLDTGPFKSTGAFGEPITDEQKEYLQGIVDTYFADFKSVVTAGRGLSEAELLAVTDGRVFIGADAEQLRLIDGIQTMEQTIAELSAQENIIVAETKQDTPTAATYADIVSACPGASPEFICEQLEGKATVAQAREDWLTLQTLANEEKDREIATLKHQLETKPKITGVEPLETGNENAPLEANPVRTIAGAARQEWQAALKAKIDAGVDRVRAVRETKNEQPDLYERMMAEANAS